MALFSERYGYVNKPLQLESISDELRNRIWNTYSFEICTDDYDYNTNYLEEIMDVFGIAISGLHGNENLKKDLSTFRQWFSKAEWYQIYDFIEAYLDYLPTQDRKDASRSFNSILRAENAGYRIVRNRVAPITNPSEIKSIEQAEQTTFSSVNTHIQKAVELFSRRPLPDYENSIKESISAVEALCCIITGQSGANATLGKMIKKLKDHGVHIHPSMENAFSSLYGYTNDETGIRHGGIDFKNAPAEDAKFMLVSCSAFVNYLIEKWSNVERSKSNPEG